MEQKILNEIYEIRKLMSLPLNEIATTTNKNLLNEIKIGIDLPNIKNYDNFKLAHAKFKGQVGAKFPDLPDFNGFKSIKNLDLSVVGNALKSITDFKGGYLTYLMQKGFTYGNAKNAIDAIERNLNKINAGTDPKLGEIVNGKPRWVQFPKDGNLQSIVLLSYKNKFGDDAFNSLISSTKDKNLKVELSTLKNENLPKNNVDAKKFGYDEAKMFKEYQKTNPTGTIKTMYNDITNGKFKPSNNTKVTKNANVINKNKITNETNPITNEKYDWVTVKDEFASTGSLEDNEKLFAAWSDKQDPWRPGKPVPEKYRTDFYNFKQSQKTANDIPEIKTKQDLKSLIEGPDKKNKLYDYGDVIDEFGVEKNNPDHIEKLSNAWQKGWRPGKKIEGEYEQFKIKDTDRSVERLVTNPNNTNNIDPKTSKPYDYIKVKEEFGSNGVNPDHNKKLYEAWEEGWRPGNPIDEKYQTDLYKASSGKTVIPFPDITPKTRNWIQSFYDFLKNWLWHRSLGQVEDLSSAWVKNPRTLKTFEKSVQGYINRWVIEGKSKSRGNLSWIREEFLKIQRNENLRNEISIDTLNKMKEDLKTEISNDIRFQNDPNKITNLQSTVDEFFTKLIGEKGEQGSLEWVFENTKQTSGLDFWKNLVFGFGKYDTVNTPKQVTGQILKTLFKRWWNVVKGGSVWNSSEALLIRNASNFKWKGALIQFALQKTFMKVIIPGLLLSRVDYFWQAVLNLSEFLTGWDFHKGEDKEVVDFMWEGLKEEWSADGSKGLLGEAAWGIIKAIVPGDLESMVENAVNGYITFTDAFKKDPLSYSYAIKYQETNPLTKEKTWVRLPLKQGVYFSWDDADKNVQDLIKRGVTQICDASKPDTSNPNWKPLVIDPKVKVACPTDKKEEEEKKKEDNKKPEEEKKKEQEEVTVEGSNTVEFLNSYATENLDNYSCTKSDKSKCLYIQNNFKVNGNDAFCVASKDNVNFICFTYIDKKVYLQRGLVANATNIKDEFSKFPGGWEVLPPKLKVESINKIIKNILSSNMKIGNRRIFEQEDEKRFGENKYDHLYDAFTFEKYDEKSGEFKEIETDSLKHGKIKERFNDFIKRYDTDDAFVRAVVDTHEDIVRIKYLKDQANISESYLPTGLALILNVIRESKGEYEIFSVSRSNGNWHLVKGDFKQKEMSKMQLTKQIPPEKQPKKKENGVESLKKKEQTGITLLNQDEKKGLVELPGQVKRKLLEKLRHGWVTEKPYEFFNEFYSVSDINTVFNDKLKIYKLKPTKEFFESLSQNSSRVFIRKGFCKSLNSIKNTNITSENGKKVLDHILDKCKTKFKGEYGVTQLNLS